MKISIITPVYNACEVLPACLASLESQSCDQMELIFVDDCSRDESRNVINEFKSSKESPARSINLIKHETNKGVAAARNTGLAAATGDYIMFVDADDILVPDAISEISALIEESHAQIIGWDWQLSSGQGSRKMAQPHYNTSEDVLKHMMSGTMRWNLWLFAIKRDFIQGLSFTPGMNMGEDMMMMMRLFMGQPTVAQIHKPLYIYRQTDSSVSKSMTTANQEQVTANLEAVVKALHESCFSYLEDEYIDHLKLSIKLPLLISTSFDDYRRWYTWFSEANDHAYCNKNLPLRTRVLQWTASKRIWPAVWLYNIVVYKIISLIYR